MNVDDRNQPVQLTDAELMDTGHHRREEQGNGRSRGAAETGVPGVLPVLPLKNGVLFPSQGMPLMVSRPGSVSVIEAALASEDKKIVIASQRDPSVEHPTLDDLYQVATLAVIKRMYRGPQGLHALVEGRRRVRLLQPDETISLEPEGPSEFLRARIQPLPELHDGGPEVEALHREVRATAGKIFELVQPDGSLNIGQVLADTEDPLEQAYLLATLMELGVERQQAILGADSRAEALELVHDYLSHELEVLTLRRQIASTAQEKISEQQREYVLRQQLEAIQDQLGEQSAEKAELDELETRLDQSELPEPIERELRKELGRLRRLPSVAADYQTVRAYLEFALELPWTRTTEDKLDLAEARRVLDEDHFDLEEVKERIIDHLAVMKLNPEAHAPILCLVGPPGVGKTSIGQSIARAIGRTFERMSLGGMHDESELRGHRRTYVGAMPGRVLQSIRRGGVRNPLLMLDEVDKLGRDFRGDPAAALMEILDPAQNHEFRDNYLNLPFDLSRVFFIATANTLDTIPRPLLDRMEVLRLSGYSDMEKREIARRYLIPRRIEQAGLPPAALELSDETLDHVIRRYTREAGVRELERMLGRLARKVARRHAGEGPDGGSGPVRIEVAALGDLLGPERFFLGEMRAKMGPGIAAGLAWTEAGGDVLYVEAVPLPRSKELTLTGHLGKVMQESAQAARSYLQAAAAGLGLDPEKVADTGAHIHVPAGAIPKDGPSAGVTMVTALASLYAGTPVRHDTAMTGEITLSGLVLPVGGVKEKVLAADRAGMRRVILPRENDKDLRDLPDEVRERLEFVLADRVPEVLAAAIPGLPEPAEVQAAS